MKSDSALDIDQLDLLIEEYADRIRKGENPDVDVYVSRYPLFAEEIRETFPIVAAMESAAAPVGNAEGNGRPSRLGDYRILREIGRGGMGVVYEAVQESLERQVALKVLPASVATNLQYLVRFRREVRAVGKLHHTNIVPVFGAGEADGVHFYAMQFIAGRDLEQVSRELQRLRKRDDAQVHSPANKANNTTVELCGQATTTIGLGKSTEDLYPYRIAELGAQAADALVHAHALGVLHRDVKPSNLLLDGNGVLWVTDFGLAKADENDDLTATGDVVGTLRYMAPERFVGKADARSDVYSLGVTLYELITLRPAFASADRAQLMREVLDSTPPMPRSIDPHIPRDFETIIQKAMAKEPERRYPTAKAMADDLRRFLRGEPILARPISRFEHALRKCQKHPALTAAISSLILLGIVSVVAILWQWRVAVAALESEAASRLDAENKGRLAISSQEAAQQALYFNRVNLAHKEWLAGNIGRSVQLLDECPESMRHWEWNYVRRLCDSDLVQFHLNGKVRCVAYSPNGHFIATCNAPSEYNAQKSELCLWDAISGEKLWSISSRYGAQTRAAFSPNSELLAVSSMELENSRMESSRINAFPRTVVWDVKTKKTAFVLDKEDRQARVVAFSADGRYLATGSDGQVAVYDGKSGKRIFVSPVFGNKNTFGIAFSPDGDRLIAVGKDGLGRIWSISKSSQIAELLCGTDARAVSWSPDGNRISTASWNGVVRIWDVATYKPIIEYERHASPVIAVAFSPDGRRVASSDYSGFIRIWDTKTGRDIATIRGHTGTVNSLAFSANGHRLVSGGDDALVRVWDACMKSQESSILIPPNGGSHHLEYTDDGKHLVASGWRSNSDPNYFDPGFRVWGEKLEEGCRYFKAHERACCTIDISNDGETIVSGSDDLTIKLSDLASGAEKCLISNAHIDKINCVVISRSGDLVASASKDKTVKVWNLNTKALAFPPLIHTAAVWRVAFSMDGRRIFTCDDSGLINVWDSQSGDNIGTLDKHQGSVRSLAVSPNGRWLATAGNDCTIHLWDIQSADQPVLVRSYSGHTDVVLSLNFSPDSRRMVSGSWDRTTKIWDVLSLNEAFTLRADPDLISSAAFSPDGNSILTASNFIRLWNARVSDAGDKQLSSVLAERNAEAWHRSEYEECMRESPQNFFAILFHSPQVNWLKSGKSR